MTSGALDRRLSARMGVGALFAQHAACSAASTRPPRAHALGLLRLLALLALVLARGRAAALALEHLLLVQRHVVLGEVRQLAQRVTEWSIKTKYSLANQVSGVSRATTARLIEEGRKSPAGGRKSAYLPHSTDDAYPRPADAPAQSLQRRLLGLRLLFEGRAVGRRS